MAVFTPLTREEISGLLGHYTLGEMQAYEGISAGIENTNYFVDTPRGRYVLTLFERLNFKQLPFYLELMRHFAQRELPVPDPQENRAGSLMSELKGKPCAIVSRINGRWLEQPTPAQCATIGTLLARMHHAGSDFPHFQPNLRGLGWWKSTVPRLQGFLDDATFDLLAEEVIHQDTFQRTPDFESLPQGPVHADLFRDNVLWDGDGIGGVIDFYFAGIDALLFDVAVTVNDWCVDQAGGIDAERAQALLAAYRRAREFTDSEKEAWPALLRAAALRFWLSRLYDYHLPRPGMLVHAHDPEHFRRVLELRIAQAPPWMD